MFEEFIIMLEMSFKKIYCDKKLCYKKNSNDLKKQFQKLNIQECKKKYFSIEQ